jgi:rubrerythrin
MNVIRNIKEFYKKHHICYFHKKLFKWNYCPFPVLVEIYECKICGYKWQEITSDGQ